MKEEDVEKDDFVSEERTDEEFEEFEMKDKGDWDYSVDDPQRPVLPDDEILDEDGNPMELNFER